MSRHLLVILAPGTPRYPRWAEVLRRGRAQVQWAPAADIAHARRLAARVAPEVDVVVAAGGDGTARAVAGGLVFTRESRAALGLLPLGTGNDFADHLGLRRLSAALEALEAGRERSVDVIEVRRPDGGDREAALLFAAAGFAPALLARTSPRLKRWVGRSLCYSAGFFRALAGFRAPWLEVGAEGRVQRGHFFHVCAGNTERAGGGAMRLSPGARFDDGRLELCWIEALGRAEVLWHFPRLLRGTFPGHPRVHYQPGSELRVDAPRPEPLALDGDVVGTTPACFRVLPGALRVVAPAAG